MTDTKTTGKKKKTKGAKKPDGRPARARYWQSQRLMLRKLRALVESGHTLEAALTIWQGRKRTRRNASEYVPTHAANRLRALMARVKAKQQAHRLRAMEKWEARERAKGGQA